jgi:hypothetical protein
LLSLTERHGIFSRCSLAEQVTCQQCDAGHAVDVISTSDGKFGHECLFNGWVDLTEDDVTLLRFDREALFKALAAAAGLERTAPKFFAGNYLVSLGLVPGADNHRDWILGYADKLEDHNVLTGVTTALADRFPGGPGLIITPSFVNLNLPLPNGYRLIFLPDVAVGTADGLALNWETAAACLGRRKKVPGPRGRPTERNAVREIWETSHTLPDWPEQRLDQAAFILSRWTEQGARPSLGTIKNLILGFERELAESSSA